jgi:hypothetical protein
MKLKIFSSAATHPYLIRCSFTLQVNENSHIWTIMLFSFGRLIPVYSFEKKRKEKIRLDNVVNKNMGKD